MSAKKLPATLFWLLVAGGCGLLPASRETLSSAEKAKLNLQMGARYLDMGMLDVAREKLETAVRSIRAMPKSIIRWRYFTSASETTMRPTTATAAHCKTTRIASASKAITAAFYATAANTTRHSSY